MQKKVVWSLVLLFALWIGASFLRGIREKSRVEALPKTVELRGPNAAKVGIPEARRIATRWDPQCELQCIVLAFGWRDNPGMGADGIPLSPSGWTYRFFSSKRGWFLDVTLWPDGQCEPSSFNGVNYLDSRPLPEDFIDSTEAIAIAEDLYGREYREKGTVFRLFPRLTTWRSSVVGPQDPVEHRPTWQIHYLTTRDRDRVDLFLVLDAVTGKELSAVESFNTEIDILTNNYHD